MYNYQGIKAWLEENKQKMVLLVCFVLVFVIGFGAGRFEKEIARTKEKVQNQTNYNTKPAPATSQQGKGEEAAAPIQAKVLGASADQTCPVKGNSSSKIYHVPGGAYYATLKSPKCFQTEVQAQAAGYRKSGR
jgi:hypothetical protein